METKVEAVNSVVKKLMIKLAPEEVETPYQQAVRELKRTASVPGFRKGKAPEKLIRARFHKELEGEMIRFVSRQTYPEAVRKHAEELGPVIFENMVDFRLQPNLSLETEFYLENLPVFDIQSLEGVKLTVPAVNKDLDEQAENVLNDLRERMARFKPVEKETAELEDYVELKLKGTDADGNTVVDNDNLDLQLKETGYFGPVAPHVIGMKPGEEKTVTVTYPDADDFGNLKGKEIRFDVTLLQIKEREVPAADDNFARELGQFDTLEELKADIRQNLEKRYQQQARNVRERTVMEHLRTVHEFEVPPSLVHEEARSLTEAYFQQMAQYGIPFEQDDDTIRAVFEQQQEEAERRVRESILLSRIADEQNIQPEDDDIDNILQDYLTEQRMDMPLDALRKGLEERGELDRIRSIARQRKTFDYLLSQVTFEETEESEDKDMADKPAGKKTATEKAKKTGTARKKKSAAGQNAAASNTEPEKNTEDSHADSDGN